MKETQDFQFNEKRRSREQVNAGRRDASSSNVFTFSYFSNRFWDIYTVWVVFSPPSSLSAVYLPPRLHISSSIFSVLLPSYVYLFLNFLVVVSHHIRDKATTWRANIERLNEGGVRGQGAIQWHARIVELGEQGVVDPVFGDAGSLISVGGPSV